MLFLLAKYEKIYPKEYYSTSEHHTDICYMQAQQQQEKYALFIYNIIYWKLI